MPPAPLAPHLRAAAPDFARRFTSIVTALAALIAHAFLRDPRFAPIIVPLWTRLTRSGRRCTALMAHLAKHGVSRHRRAGHNAATISPADSPAPRKPPHAPTAKIPTAEAWLLKSLQDVASYRNRLIHLLATPGAAELLAAAPTTSRFLRPLCRMLAIPMPFIPGAAASPAQPSTPAPSTPAPPAPPSPAPPPAPRAPPRAAPRSPPPPPPRPRAQAPPSDDDWPWCLLPPEKNA